MIGVNDAKDTLMHRLHIENPGPGYVHFPKDRELDWFEQLTNEIVKKKFFKGRLIREWTPRKDGVRTEALDCRVYAYAALRGLIRNYRLDLNTTADYFDTLPIRSANDQTAQKTNTTISAPIRRRVRSKGLTE